MCTMHQLEDEIGHQERRYVSMVPVANESVTKLDSSTYVGAILIAQALSVEPGDVSE